MFVYMYEFFCFVFCLVCVCVCVCVMFVQGLLLCIDLRKGLCMKRFEMCVCLQQSLNWQFANERV